MAIWHFDCSLVPQKWLDNDVGRHLVHRMGENPDFESAWRTRSNDFSIIEFCDTRLNRIVPPRQESPLTLLRWSCDNGNEIQVQVGHGNVTGVRALIDTRQPYGDFSTLLLELAVLSKCLLHFAESGRFVEPLMETLVAAIGGSEAAHAARDPGNDPSAGLDDDGDLSEANQSNGSDQTTPKIDSMHIANIQ